MNNELAKTTTPELAGDIMHKLVGGDIGELSPKEQVAYYLNVCRSLGLNHLTQPFNILVLDGKTVLYATRSCSDQLRQINGVSVTIAARERIGDVYSVTARATDKHGRVDESTGVVALVKEDGKWEKSSSGKSYFAKNGKLIPLVADALANSYMKAETKAKRRVTLSICGLGWMDETEAETIPGAQKVEMPVASVATVTESVIESVAEPAASVQPDPTEPPAGRDNHLSNQPAESHAPTDEAVKAAYGKLYNEIRKDAKFENAEIKPIKTEAIRLIRFEFPDAPLAELTAANIDAVRNVLKRDRGDGGSAPPAEEPLSDLPFDQPAQ